MKEKIKAIENFDKEVVAPILDGLKDLGYPFRMLIVTDHFTPIVLKTHAPGLVPFIIYDSTDVKENEDAAYNEKAAERSELVVEQGYRLLSMLIGREPKEIEMDRRRR